MSFLQQDMIGITGVTYEYCFYSKTFKQLQIHQCIDIPHMKPDIEQIIGVNINCEIISTNIISTPCSISSEGQKLTGYKMVVEGKIDEKIQYIADNPVQSVHAAEFTKYFSSYIMLDPNINCNNPYDVNCYIEDIYIKQISNRQIFQNVMILLQAVPLNQPTLNDICNDKDENILDCDCNKIEYFSQFSVEEIINVPKVKPDIEQIISTVIDAEIISLKFINTLKGISVEGQRLTGKKAVVELKFKQKILYAAEEPEQSIHGIETEFYTSAYVVIHNYIEGTDPSVLLKKGLIRPMVTVEDIFLRQISERSLFKNLTLFVKLDILPTYEICYLESYNCYKNNLFITYEDGNCKVPIFCDNGRKISKPTWSPLGNEFAYIESCEYESYIILMDINNLKPKKLNYFNNFQIIHSFCFAEKGRKIICSAMKNNNRDIYIIDILNKRFRNLTNNNGFIKNLSPKYSDFFGKIIYIKSLENVKNLWMMNLNGSENTQLTQCGFINSFDCCNQRNEIIFASGKGNCNDKLYCMDINCLESKLLVDDSKIMKIKKVKYSTCGMLIAFIGVSSISDNLYVVEVNSRRVTNLTKFDCNTSISDFTWKVDSNKLYYACNYLGYYNIFSISLDGGVKAQLTNSNSNRIQLDYRPTIR